MAAKLKIFVNNTTVCSINNILLNDNYELKGHSFCKIFLRKGLSALIPEILQKSCKPIWKW